MGGVAHVLRVDRGTRHAPDRDDRTALRERGEERTPRVHLVLRGAPIRGRPAGQVRVRRDGVPEQRLLLDPKLGENAVHDGGRRLRRAVPGELPLGGGGDPRVRAPR